MFNRKIKISSKLRPRNSDGPDGKLHDSEIRYVLGVDPLQQYMIEFSDGRIQVLDIAWDTHSREEGGQRWFHLHPDEKITPNHIFHWTRRFLNWNYMCAECHTTNLQKNYDPETDTFKTTWSEIDVGCQACHGPGSNHVEWARDLQDMREGEIHFAEIFAAGQAGKPEAALLLIKLAEDKSKPAIVRATALHILQRYRNEQTLHAISSALNDLNPLVRYDA